MLRLLTFIRPFSLIGHGNGAGCGFTKQTELIEKLLQRIDQLEKRVTELETVRPAQPTVALGVSRGSYPCASASGSDGPRPWSTCRPVGDLSFTPAFGLWRHKLYGEWTPGTHGSFNEGQFILHMTSALSSRVNYFGELSFDRPRPMRAAELRRRRFNVEMERSINPL